MRIPERRQHLEPLFVLAGLCELSSRLVSREIKIHGLEDSLVNNCPNCKKIIAELKMSMVKAKLKSLPAFDCVTLCCPFCGVILLAVPELEGAPADVQVPNGH